MILTENLFRVETMFHFTVFNYKTFFVSAFFIKKIQKVN